MAHRDPTKLFEVLSTDLARYINEQQAQVGRDVLSFPVSQGDRLGHTLFSNLTTGGFCTLVVSGRRTWDPRSHYHQAARFAAKRGCQIERAFLLPHRACRHDPTLQEHVRLDVAAGIKIKILFVGHLIDTLTLPLSESLEFGLWDETVGCIAVPGQAGLSAGISEWKITRRPEDLQVLNDIVEVLASQATEVTEEKDEAPELEEPMITTAPMAYELAMVLCRGDHVSPEDCSWYHSIWQYLRIFDMVSTPTWHASFYREQLANLANVEGFERGLISGTADYSVLAHVLWAFRRKTVPNITVVDLCETPLFLCKWYGKLVGVRVEAAAADILEYKSDRPFDFLATDAFLTRFDNKLRHAVVEQWHRLLRPGGIIITTARIESGLSGRLIRATPDQADAFRRRALQEARRWQGFIGRPLEEIANGAQRYAERMTSYSLGSAEELSELLTACGFAIDYLQVACVPGEMASTDYAEVVAHRL